MSIINEQLVVEAAPKTYLRWDDAEKDWTAAEQLGEFIEAEVVSDIIVDTPEELERIIIADDPDTPENECNHVAAESVSVDVVKVDVAVEDEEEDVEDPSTGDADEEDGEEGEDPSTGDDEEDVDDPSTGKE